MKKKQQIHKGIEISSLSANGGRGRVHLRAAIDADAVRPNAKLAETIKANGKASLFFDFAKNQSKSDNFNFERIEDVLPDDADFIYVPFRALSQTLVERGHYLDFTGEGVLEAAVDLLRGATIYPNHDHFDINNALGVVSDVNWDAEDKAGKGAPGINALYKIDALLNPRIARLLLIKAIHSTSLTILFDFEFSHPDLVEQGRFWDLLGEEVEGSIVRLIITEIVDIWEASLVHQGADRMARVIAETDDDQEEESFEADDDPVSLAAKGADDPPPNSNEEKTMEIPKEKREALGIGFDGDDVPESEILKAAETLAAKVDELTQSTEAQAVADLTKRAEAGDALVEEKRTEVTRLATLAELGSEKGELPAVIADDIKGASVERLKQLGDHYGAKVGDKFKRSSVEDSETVDSLAAGDKVQTNTADDPTGGLVS